MKESIKKFVEALSGDAALRKALQAELKKAGSKDETIKIALEFAAAHGFEFTAADLEAEKAELSDEELAAISGGKGCGCPVLGFGDGSKGQKCKCFIGGMGDNTNCMCAIVGMAWD